MVTALRIFGLVPPALGALLIFLFRLLHISLTYLEVLIISSRPIYSAR